MKNWLRRKRDGFAASVASKVARKLVARQTDSFDLLDVAWGDAALDSARYYTEHMLHAQCFSDDVSLRHFSIGKRQIDGLVLEFGVATGRTTNQIAKAINPQRIYGFDGFSGLPEDWTADLRRGAFAQSIPQVDQNVELVVGMFDQTLPVFLKEHATQQVAFLHIDCDLYSSTRTIFEQLGTRIARGTVIMFDEYFNYPGWRAHEYKAFQEFVASRALKYTYLGFNRSDQQVTVVIE